MLQICDTLMESLSNAAQSLEEYMTNMDANIAKLNEERRLTLESYEAIKNAYDCLVSANEKQHKIPSASNEWTPKTASSKITNF